MSEAVSTATKDTKQETANRNIKNHRRYVGTKETLAYIVYDISASFNITKYNDIFITDIVKIGLKFQTVVTFVIGIWDVINDIFLAAIVDRTRTRFGKFKPWLILYAGPGMLLSFFFWLMPVIFANTTPYDTTKLVAYMIFQLISNLATSMNNIAKTGMLSTITPNIIDRTRLITQANLFSGFVEKGPELLMGFLIDLVNHDVLKIKMPSLYVSAGMITAFISGFMALYFSLVAKERVLQKEEKPSILQGVKSIVTNKPLLILTLNDLLGALSIDFGLNYYYINVLGLASMSTIVGIPGAFISPVSYAFVTKARERFSTKALWIFSSHVPDALLLGVFAIGSINKNYTKISVMIPAFMARETIWMCFYGISKVIPEEMRNECIDYGEWKTGYRTEGITGVAKGLASKLVGTVGNGIKAIILSRIGYKEGAGYGGQSAKTEYMLFAMCTGVPVLTSSIALLPKLFYPLNAETKDRMYSDLAQRRKEIMDSLNQGRDANLDETDK